jgi:hypothetical protein
LRELIDAHLLASDLDAGRVDEVNDTGGSARGKERGSESAGEVTDVGRVETELTQGEGDGMSCCIRLGR